MRSKLVLIPLLFILSSCTKPKEVNYQKEFGERDACLLISEIKTGKEIVAYNKKRCEERFSPCSSFKIAAALMAFETGKLKDENQVITWDKKKRLLPQHNRNQTPLTWMSHSAMWVTQWLTPQIGKKSIDKFLNDFSYGDKDFSGGIDKAWQTSSLKISAQEQAYFLKKLWKEELPLSKRTFELTKKVIYIRDVEDAVIYGKTGTGCLKGTACMEQADKMLGWFVGILKNGSKEYVFAANASDLQPERAPAGPRLRNTVIRIFKLLQLTD